ncbi:hypothetical protein L486_01133 [Kwoniella mangroviensis CBS 10435]|uniref:BRCT domain-containing protein n=1 Tax=Kwoniella mangroviensis CBS 10435 TaxID=1331196 RepID=A0A1B9J123_9TREE|nr:hypothetical protein L486_01133 [Kwoniella mangroviensis CBS 10435]
MSTKPSHTPSISLYRHRTNTNNCPDLKRKRYGPYPTTPIRYSSSSAETSSSSFTRPSATRLDISRTPNLTGRNGCSTYTETSTPKSYAPGLYATGRHQQTPEDIDPIEIDDDHGLKQQQEQRKDQDHFGRSGQKVIGSDFAQTENSFDSEEVNKDPDDEAGDDSDLDCLDSDYEEERDIPDSQSHSPLTTSMTNSTIYHAGRDDIHNGISSKDREYPHDICTNSRPAPWEITILKIEERLSYLRARWKVDFTPSTNASWDKTRMARITSTPSLLVRDPRSAPSSFKAGDVGHQMLVVNEEDSKIGESLHHKFDLDTFEDNHQPNDAILDTQKMNIRMIHQHQNVEDGGISIFDLPHIGVTQMDHPPVTNVPLKADIILFHRERDDTKSSTPRSSQELQLFYRAFERGQKVLSSLWVEDSIKIGKFQDEGPYEIWLDESDIPKKRAAAIKADKKRTTQHDTMRSLFHRRIEPNEQETSAKKVDEQSDKSEVLDLGSELESDEEFDGIGGIRKVGEKDPVTLHQFKSRTSPRA